MDLSFFVFLIFLRLRNILYCFILFGFLYGDGMSIRVVGFKKRRENDGFIFIWI